MTNEEKIERIRLLRPIDDTFFEVLMQSREVCQEILRVILSDETLLVEQVIPQAHMQNLYGRSVCLDALCVMGDGKKCNVEVQRADSDNHLKRVRFHASVITARDSETGMRFDEVLDLCVVYISEKDFLKGGKPIYHIDKVIRETGERVDDGLQEIFVNAEVNDNSEIAQLMECFKQQEIGNPGFPELSAEVKRLKETEGGLGPMCKIVQEIVEAERKEEREAERIAAIQNLIKEGFSKEVVLKLKYTEEEYAKAEAELRN